MPTSGKRSHKPATSQCNRCIHQRSSSATTTASAETATGNHTSNRTNRLHDHVSPRATATMTRIIASTEPAITTTPTTTTRPRAMSQQRSCGRDLSPTLQRPPPPPQPKNIKPLQTTIPNYRRHRPKILDKASGHKSSSLVPYGWSSQTVLPHPPVRPSVSAASSRGFASPRFARQLRNFLLLNRTNWLLKQTVNLKLSLHRQLAARPDALYMNMCVAWTFQVWTIKLQ